MFSFAEGKLVYFSHIQAMSTLGRGSYVLQGQLVFISQVATNNLVCTQNLYKGPPHGSLRMESTFVYVSIIMEPCG